MLGLLKRHEVQVLLKAGHKRTEVSRLTGISRSSVQRISAEATTEQFDDTAERLKRRIGRPSIVKGFWESKTVPLRGSGVVAPDQFDQHAERSL